MSNNNTFLYILNGMNSYYWSILNYLVLSNGLSDTIIHNELIWFGLMSEWYINFPNNRASFKMRMYTVPS